MGVCLGLLTSQGDVEKDTAMFCVSKCIHDGKQKEEKEKEQMALSIFVMASLICVPPSSVK